MRLTLLAIASGLFLSVSASMSAADPQSAAAAAAPEPMATSAAASPVSEDQKVICHHPVHEGTVMPQEICLTKRSWDRIRMRDQKNVDDFQHRSFSMQMK
jgi:Spy/CpxP family protein refolding chaperone